MDRTGLGAGKELPALFYISEAPAQAFEMESLIFKSDPYIWQ